MLQRQLCQFRLSPRPWNQVWRSGPTLITNERAPSDPHRVQFVQHDGLPRACSLSWHDAQLLEVSLPMSLFQQTLELHVDHYYPWPHLSADAPVVPRQCATRQSVCCFMSLSRVTTWRAALSDCSKGFCLQESGTGRRSGGTSRNHRPQASSASPAPFRVSAVSAAAAAVTACGKRPRWRPLADAGWLRTLRRRCRPAVARLPAMRGRRRPVTMSLRRAPAGSACDPAWSAHCPARRQPLALIASGAA